MNTEFYEPIDLFVRATLMILPLAVPISFLRYIVFKK